MSLAAIRAKLQAQETRTQPQQQQYSGDKASYAFWNMPEGAQSILRFLPDADAKNEFFWVERNMIKLPFQGVVGGDMSKQYTVQVPCVEMWGDNCPILAEVRTWYKDESLKQLANKYWKKRTYLFQGFVRQSGFTEEGGAPENPIRRFVVTPQLFAIIKASLMDTQIEEIPTDFTRGLDFIIKKGKKGEFADYSTSNWARRESALTQEELDAIDQYNLYDLKSFLPKKPSESELRVIKDMFEASVDGRPYDTKWAAYYKPYGLNIEGAGESHSDDESSYTPQPASVSVAPKAPVVDEEPSGVSDVKITAPSGNANDILALIRSRQNKPA